MPGQAYQAHQVLLKPQGVTSPRPVTNRPPRARTAAVRHVPAHESERPAASLVKFRRCCPCALLSEAPLPRWCDSGLQQQVSDEPSWSPSQNPCTLLASVLFPPHPWSLDSLPAQSHRASHALSNCWLSRGNSNGFLSASSFSSFLYQRVGRLVRIGPRFETRDPLCCWLSAYGCCAPGPVSDSVSCNRF